MLFLRAYLSLAKQQRLFKNAPQCKNASINCKWKLAITFDFPLLSMLFKVLNERVNIGKYDINRKNLIKFQSLFYQSKAEKPIFQRFPGKVKFGLEPKKIILSENEKLRERKTLFLFSSSQTFFIWLSKKSSESDVVRKKTLNVIERLNRTLNTNEGFKIGLAFRDKNLQQYTQSHVVVYFVDKFLKDCFIRWQPTLIFVDKQPFNIVHDLILWYVTVRYCTVR